MVPPSVSSGPTIRSSGRRARIAGCASVSSRGASPGGAHVPDRDPIRARQPRHPRVPAWVRLGDDLLFVGDEPAPAVPEGRAARRHPKAVRREDLHVVTQIGAVFERAHPEVPIVVDKGRYLVVELEPARAADARPRRARLRDPTARGRQRGVRDAAARRAPAARRGRPSRRSSTASTLRRSTRRWRRSCPSRRGSRRAPASAARRRRRGRGSTRSATRRGPSRWPSAAGGRRTSSRTSRERHPADARARGGRRRTSIRSTTTDGPSGSAPGADDNASGSAGLLEMARVLAEHGGTARPAASSCSAARSRASSGARTTWRGSPPADRGADPRGREHGHDRHAEHARADRAARRCPDAQAVIDGLAEAAAAYTGARGPDVAQPVQQRPRPVPRRGHPRGPHDRGRRQQPTTRSTRRGHARPRRPRLLLEILRMNVAFVATALGVGEPAVP